jgi:hypothetical protein
LSRLGNTDKGFYTLASRDELWKLRCASRIPVMLGDCGCFVMFVCNPSLLMQHVVGAAKRGTMPIDMALSFSNYPLGPCSAEDYFMRAKEDANRAANPGMTLRERSLLLYDMWEEAENTEEGLPCVEAAAADLVPELFAFLISVLLRGAHIFALNRSDVSSFYYQGRFERQEAMLADEFGALCLRAVCTHLEHLELGTPSEFPSTGYKMPSYDSWKRLHHDFAVWSANFVKIRGLVVDVGCFN